MKKFLSIILTVIMMLSAVIVVAEEKDITVFVDGVEISFDVAPQIINERTMVPLRAVFEALDASVKWDEETRTITSTRDVINIKITVGENIMYKNSKPVNLDTPAQIVNDRTLVPLRAVAEAFGCYVNWNDTKRSVSIMSPEFITSQGEAWERAKTYVVEANEGEYEMYTEDGISTIMYNEYTDSVMIRYTRDDSDSYICNAIVNFYKDNNSIRVCVVYSPATSPGMYDAELYIDKKDVVRGMKIEFEDDTVPEINLSMMSDFMSDCLPYMLDDIGGYFASVDVSIQDLGLVNYR